MIRTHEELVLEFMLKNNQTVSTRPNALIADSVKVLRLRLMMEELGELAEAMHTGNLVAIADGLADLEYVVVGTALAYGIPYEEVFLEVHRSNMTKPSLDRNNKGGKVQKEGFTPPNIEQILSEVV